MRQQKPVCKPPGLLLCGLVGCWLLQASIFKAQTNTTMFHLDRQRTGWNSNETALTPTSVAGTNFGLLWNSPMLDSVTINSTVYAPHLYATPLYIDDVLITALGKYNNRHFSVVFAASSNGWVYAINAFANTTGGPLVSAGTILWKKFLGPPAVVGSVDGGVPLGVLSTPVIDLNTAPPRLYVASQVGSLNPYWKVFAVDIGSGKTIPRWPLAITDGALRPLNQNGPAMFQATTLMSQRGSLNLSNDGSVLYVPFGGYSDHAAGWMVAVDTLTPKLRSAFSGAPSTVATANGGMWGSGGPALDTFGNIYDTTGNSPTGSDNANGTWGESVLVWHAAPSLLQLLGTYTPWNYCQMDTSDIDLGGDSPIIVPDLNPATTSTPHLVAFGSKQGNLYIVDRDHLPGGLTARQACSTDSTTDLSLLPPGPQPQFGARGPLNVFGPYSETGNHTDFAKARTTPAYFQGADGTPYIFYSGATKASDISRDPVPPSVVRLKIVTSAGQPAYLAVDAADTVLKFLSPGSAVVTSNGSATPIVWVLDANLFRTQPLIGSNVPHPILYAIDAMTMNLLWSSPVNLLDVGGKYNTATISRGVVFVGTDRIQAFGLTGP
jgi:hypothetical protein